MDPQMIMALLAQLGQGQQEHPLARAFGGTPMYGGVPIRPSQMFDMTALGMNPASPAGMATGMLLQSFMPQLMGPDFTPGQFLPTQNLFDHRYAVQQTINRQRAIQQAAQADTETYFRMIRGMSRMTGMEVAPGSAQEASIRRFAGDVTTFMPMLAQMMPDLVDRLSGERGSAQVMAMRMTDAARYTIDPVTGRLGASQATTDRLAHDVFQHLFGPGADISRMRSLGAGRAGDIYTELVRRGYGVPTELTHEERIRSLQTELSRPERDIESAELRTLRRDIGRQYGIGANDQNADAFRRMGEALQNMGQANPQAMENALRSFNVSRVSKSIENMAGAVSAMRDIFGDMGRPNAPMVELINGLQTLTQGGMAHMTPQQLETSVRRTYALARSTGLGIEGMLGFMSTAGQTLDQLGLNRGLAPQIANSAAAYGSAYGLSGVPRAYGQFDREMASQMDIRLRAGAAASPAAGRVAALMQLADQFVRPGGQTGFAPGTEAYAIAEAVRSGQSTYDFGGRTGLNIAQAHPRMLQILTAAGVAPNIAGSYLSMAPQSFETTINQHNIQDLIRTSQGRLDMMPSYMPGYISAAVATLSRPGLNLNVRQRGELATRLGTEAQRIVMQIAEQNSQLLDAGRERELNSEIARQLRASLGNQIPPGVTDDMLQNFAAAAIQNAEAWLRNPMSGRAGMRTYRNDLIMNTNRIQRMQGAIQQEAASMARMQQTVSGLGDRDVVQRASEYFQNLPQGTSGSFRELAFHLLGGIKSDEVAGPLQALLEERMNLFRQYDEVGTRFANDPERRRREEESILSNIALMGRDINRLVLSGGTNINMAGLSAYSRSVVDRHMARPAGERNQLSVENTAVTTAQNNYFNAYSAAINAGATPQNVMENGDVLIAHTRMTEAYRTLNESRARTGLAPLAVPSFEQLVRDRAIAEHTRIRNAAIGSDTDVTRLSDEATQVSQEIQGIQNSLAALEARGLGNSPEAQQLRDREAAAQRRLREIHTNYRAARARAGERVDANNPHVQGAAAAVRAANSNLPGSLPNIPTGPSEAQTTISAAGGSALWLAAEQVPRVAEGAFGAGGQTGSASGTAERRPQVISGELRLTGLDRGFFQGQICYASDGRSNNDESI